MTVLSYGFRTFFLLAGIHAALAVPASLAMYLGYGDWPLDWPLEWPVGLWHAHEMVFGYTLAVVAGFLLTAVPAWRKTAPVAGGRLALLAAVWLAGRAAMWGAAVLPASLVAAVDMAFVPLLIALGLPSLWAPGAGRNRVFLVILALMVAANALYHAAAAGLVDGVPGLAVDIIVLLIAVLGGRIVPAFTASALEAGGRRGAVATSPWAGGIAVAAVAAMAVADLVAGFRAEAAPLAAGLALVAAAANGWRMGGWATRHILDRPMVWVLHLGYAWLVAGLALKGLAGFGVLDPASAAHGLTIGAIGTMTLGVMTRAALGHTGRPVVAPPAIAAAYLLVSLAALARLAAAAPALTVPALWLAAAAWTAAFSIFTVIFAPILTQPRVVPGGGDKDT